MIKKCNDPDSLNFGREIVLSCLTFKNRKERNKAINEIIMRRPLWSRNNVLYSRRRTKEKPLETKIENKSNELVRNRKINFKKDKCEICHSKKNLVIHHKKYTINPEDWQVLCQKCHVKIHKKPVIQKKCSICNKKHYAKGLCASHYYSLKFRQSGDKMVKISLKNHKRLKLLCKMKQLTMNGVLDEILDEYEARMK